MDHIENSYSVVCVLQALPSNRTIHHSIFMLSLALNCPHYATHTEQYDWLSHLHKLFTLESKPNFSNYEHCPNISNKETQYFLKIA